MVDVSLAGRARPVSTTGEQLLPVLPCLAPLLPGGGLQRGAVVTVSTGGGGTGASAGGGTGVGRAGGGATTLAFALLAAASAAGSWCAAIGTADPGILALAEMGVDLGRLVLVPRPGGAWPEVAAVLLDELDAVLVCPPGRTGLGVARRLAGRARHRRTVLVVRGGRGVWPEGAEVQLTVETSRWEGVDGGHGHLRGRHVEVVTSGRRSAGRERRTGLWLPATTGVLSPG
jgi:hypothetical protein